MYLHFTDKQIPAYTEIRYREVDFFNYFIGSFYAKQFILGSLYCYVFLLFCHLKLSLNQIQHSYAAICLFRQSCRMKGFSVLLKQDSKESSPRSLERLLLRLKILLIACPCGLTIHFSFFYVPK